MNTAIATPFKKINALSLYQLNRMVSLQLYLLQNFYVSFYLNLHCAIISVKQATKLISWSATKADLY